ncbi:TonB-dependent receptor [Sphingobium jiangsuense]|uniref:Iron complex outermembrane receptor protein n=1 Tax=Sphingobium jiangsuense TaxID=870476 RepID=A0A7W6BGR8_9SPHN|nr:TonB-dependent receptor [Sphingobium jiangsuense]MBB3924587.1 iron complex outermembrane receptor protein [Sphingobium jiangsuense]GLT01705.1 TonB-dependent receptor [Sphingobium jiangsuense]
MVRWLAGAGIGALLAAPALAAEEVADAVAEQPLADAEKASGGLDIIVTASRREESVQRTPIAVTALTSDGIEQQQVATFRDLSGRIPGLLAPKRSTAYTTQTYAVRGIGETDTYPEPTVAVYVDDVYLARTVGSLYDAPDLERVEVLRGPQGTLYGRNSSAGAIRFITRDPTAEPELYVSGSYGSFDNVNLKLRANGGILADDKLNGSLSVIRHVRDGWTWSVPLNRDVNDLDLWVLRGKLKSRLTDRLTVTLSADAMFDRSTQSYYTPINQPDGVTGTGNRTDPDLTWSNTLPYNYTNAYGGSLTLRYEVDDHLVLKSVTAYRGLDGPIYYDNDGVQAIKGDSHAGFRQYQKTQELNLNGEYEKLNFVLGFYYFYEYFMNDRLSQAAGSTVDNVGSVSAVQNWLRTTSYSVFGQAKYAFDDRFTLTLGGRWTQDRRGFRSLISTSVSVPLHHPQEWDYDPRVYADLFGPFQNNYDVRPERRSFSNFSPKVGLQAQWASELFQYLSWSKGFKSGGFDLRSSSLVGSSQPYRPQVITTWETGLKSTLAGGNLTANLSVFHNAIKDLQVRATSPATPTTPSFSGILNAASGETYGAEFELSALPFDGLRIDASAAWLKTAYKNFSAVLPANLPGRTTLVGLEFPLAPRWQSSVAVNYRLPLRVEGAWRIGLDAQYESARWSDIYNTAQTRIQKQLFVNGTINYTSEDGDWAAGLYVTNLFDLRRAQMLTYTPNNSGVYPNHYAAYNLPRMVNITLSKTFR